MKETEMNAQTTRRIDADRTLALLDRLDPSWHEPCTVDGCRHCAPSATRRPVSGSQPGAAPTKPRRMTHSKAA
jgi:hypothetical protein